MFSALLVALWKAGKNALFVFKMEVPLCPEDKWKFHFAQKTKTLWNTVMYSAVTWPASEHDQRPPSMCHSTQRQRNWTSKHGKHPCLTPHCILIGGLQKSHYIPLVEMFFIPFIHGGPDFFRPDFFTPDRVLWMHPIRQDLHFHPSGSQANRFVRFGGC